MAADISSHHWEGSGTNDTTPNRRSKVWEYFERDLVMVEGVMKAVCKFCGLKLTSAKKSGTNSLRNHIAESCPKITDDDRNRFVATMKKHSEEAFTFDPRRSRELMIRWCIHAEVPFNKFEDPCFTPWMESMQPTYDSIGRQTARNDCVGMFERVKQELRSELQSLDSRISFTSDLWTSNQKLGYICLTAHYVDANFVLHKKILAFKDVKYPHTDLAIEEAITKCLTEWGIKSKIFTLTLDNAPNNKLACDLLQESGKDDIFFGGEHMFVRCCAHILNILVQDGMGVAHMAIELIRELIRHIDSSPGRIQVFNEIAQRAGLPAKSGLILDVPNRWNSTHAMLVEALKYKVVLKRYAKKQVEPSPSGEQWDNVKTIADFLGAFEEATKAFSADRKPTSHLFLHNVLCIHHALRDRGWQVNRVLEDLASAMSTKFDKYWDDNNYNMALVVATILDPSKKLEFLEFFYEKVCESIIDIRIRVNMAKHCLTKYFEAYEALVRRNSSSPCVSGAGNLMGSPVLGKRRMEVEFAQFRSQRRRHVPVSEFDAYLKEDLVRGDERFEILRWWKTNANKYPVLSAMARDFLAIPLSIVSSESAFSCGGRILSDSRSSMTPETLEALVCTKDWMYESPNNEDP